MSTIPIPLAFAQRMSAILSQEGEVFLHALDGEPSLSVRANRHKPVSPFFDGADNVPWCEQARYLAHRPDFTADPLLHAGVYYVQEASSMFIQFALQQVLDTNQQLRALDVCAAPGGKSTLLLDTLSDDSLLVSNEVIRQRASVLRENISKWGCPNVLVTNNDPQAFRAVPDFFDVVLVDAPCSGEGMFRKDPAARKEWSPEHVQLCAARQQRILADVAGTVKSGGFLLYSTCTFGDEENENQLQHMVASGAWESVSLNIPSEWNITTTQNNGVFGYRFYPHKTKGEGFFLSMLRRLKDEALNEPVMKSGRQAERSALSAKDLPVLQKWVHSINTVDVLQMKDLLVAIPRSLSSDYHHLRQRLNIIQCGITLGKLIRDELIPAHELALSTMVNEQVPRVALSREQAIMFLKKGNLQPESHWPKGWVLMCFNHYALGWAKVLDKRINNYYPTEWRILKDIEF
jgi:16S rRNA C967 or C1407 C5-methylase (RsmB/RsmF family)/NOL1/NOP2/fmu family ribosome biogenesis protein